MNDTVHLSLDLLQNICRSASQGELLLVDKYCKVKRSKLNNIDQQLFPINDICRGLLQKLDHNKSIVYADAESFLRALLLISPEYETPWMTVNLLIENIHSQSDGFGSSTALMYSGLAYAQTFLQRSIASLWKIDQVGSETIRTDASSLTPRKWLLQICQTASRPLFKLDGLPNNGTTDNRHLILPMDLIVTVLSLCRELEGPTSTIITAVLDHVFTVKIEKTMLLPLLKLTYDVQVHLRDVDWQVLLKVVREALKDQSIPLADLPGIAESIISLSGENHDWRHLLLFLFEASASDFSTYSTISNVIQSTLSSKSTRELYAWYSIDTPNTVREWVVANYFLLLFEATRSSGSQLVSQLLGEALGKTDPVFDILALCSQSLLRLCFPPQMIAIKKTSRDTLSRLFNDISYEGRGKFKRSGKPVQNFNLAILCQSLYAGSTQLKQRTHRFVAAERAQVWIHIASTLLAEKDSSGVAAIFIIIVIFYEIPVSRHTLVRKMLANGKSLGMSDCIILLALVKSLSSEELEALSPICKYFTSNELPFDLFQKLADAFSSTCFGRTALLSASQKNLYFSSAPWWYKAENKSNRNDKEILQSALYSFCVLLKEWDDTSWTAWNYLSDFIVLNKPSLPVELRTWLYRELYTMARNHLFPVFVLEHIMRALLVRLLLYFDVLDGEILFCPKRALTSFGSHRGTLVNDDLVSLLEVTIEISLQLSKEAAIGSDALVEFHRLLKVIRQDPEKVTTEISLNEGSILKYKLPMILLACSFLFVHQSKNGIKINPEPSTNEKYIKNLVNDLIAEEKTTFDGSPGNMPEWLSRPGDSSCTDNVELSTVSYAPLCDLVIQLVCSSFVTAGEEEYFTLAQSLLFVCSTKETLTPLKVDSLSSLNLLLHSVMGMLTFLSKTLPVDHMSSKIPLEEVDTLYSLLKVTCKNITFYVTDISTKYSTGDREVSDKILSLLVKISLLYEEKFNEKQILVLVRRIQREKQETSASKQVSEPLLIKWEEEMDEIIRELKTNVLQSIIDCLNVPFIVDSMDTLLSFKLGAGIANTASDQNTECLDFFLHLIKVTCNTLLADLGGQSGGVTGLMFSQHITILEKVLKMILKAACQFEIQNATAILNQASNILDEILIEYSIEVPALLKRTFRIVTKLLPSLYQANATIYADFPRERCYPGAKLVRILRTEVISRYGLRSSTMNIKPSTKENIVENTDERQNDSDSDEFGSITNEAGIPAEIAIPETPSRAENGTGTSLYSDLKLEEILSILFSSIESNFCATISVLNRQELKATMPCDFKSNSYYECRREDLSECIYFMYQLSKEFEKMEEKTMVKFMGLVDKLLLLLIRCLRVLQVSNENYNLVNRASTETVCVLLAWASEENASFLKHLLPLFSTGKGGNRGVPITGFHSGILGKKLSKLVLRLHELESVLQKALSSVITWSATSKSTSYLIFDDLEKLLSNKLKLEFPQQDQEKCAYMKYFMEKQLSFAIKSRSGFDNILVSTNKKKREANNDLAERVRKERRCPIPRSRNPVVDKWLKLDDVLVDDADGDAYVDLEDFVVEG